MPHKLGHIAFHVTDVKAITRFYCDVLGFRVSDWMGDYFSFLRCGKDHHTINLVETGTNKHFHTAFELRDWATCRPRSIGSARMATARCGAPAVTASAANLFSYHRSPNGMITELFAELDQMNEDVRLLRTAPVAPRQSAAAEDMAEDAGSGQSVGPDAARRNDGVNDGAEAGDAP